MRLALLDVGHGNCLVAHEMGRAIVVDCPPGRVLPDYLFAERISIVDDLIISHADKDHAGGVPSLIKSGTQVRRVWITDDQANKTVHYRLIARAFSFARREGAYIRRGYPHSDEPPLRADGVTVEFLAPQHEDRMLEGNRNRMSVMTRISYGDRGIVLLPGDIDAAGYELLVDQDRDYSAEWLVAPHHGGLGGTSAATQRLLRALLQRSGARELFFSFARVSSYDLPRKELLRLVMREFPGTRVRCSQLSVHCATEHPLRLSGASFHHPISEGVKDKEMRSCAGSVVLDLTEGSDWRLAEAHDTLVRRVGPSAMCIEDAP